MRKPAYSTLAAPRPKPNRQRPPDIHVEQRDLFGHADRIVPWEHDDGGPKG